MNQILIANTNTYTATREEVHKRLRSKAETFSQLINLVQLKEALAKGKLDITEEGEEEEDSLADLKIKAKDIIISNPIAQETIKRLSLSRGRNINRSSENFQALKVAAVPKAPQLILNIVINDVEGKNNLLFYFIFFNLSVYYRQSYRQEQD